MLVFCEAISPRLQYIADFISDILSGTPATLITEKKEFISGTGIRINYSKETIPGAVQVIPQGLLFENDIRPQTINCFSWKEAKVFFETAVGPAAAGLPFDIFAASFYLLSRYEEYLPHQKDIYGRYAHENSLAFKENFLHQPLINEWLLLFAEVINNRFPTFNIRHSPFTFIPTYDIDIAWSYKHKGFIRNAGGLLRSLLHLRLDEVQRRWRVLFDGATDPYDAYAWLNALHKKYQLNPVYFFLLAANNGVYDKNILPNQEALKKLVAGHSGIYQTGIHPSWQSGDDNDLMREEIKCLAAITGKAVFNSRQHYLRFSLPDTYRLLIANCIRFDYSMGYGTINGFRASVATPFKWYDLQREEATSLVIYPFCFMDANAFYEEKKTAGEALIALQDFYEEVKKVNGVFIMIWHNQFLGTHQLFAGWKEIYQQFIAEISGRKE